MYIYRVTFYRASDKCRDEVIYLFIAGKRDDAIKKVNCYQNKYFNGWHYVMTHLHSDPDNFYPVGESFQ